MPLSPLEQVSLPVLGVLGAPEVVARLEDLAGRLENLALDSAGELGNEGRYQPHTVLLLLLPEPTSTPATSIYSTRAGLVCASI